MIQNFSSFQLLCEPTLQVWNMPLTKNRFWILIGFIDHKRPYKGCHEEIKIIEWFEFEGNFEAIYYVCKLWQYILIWIWKIHSNLQSHILYLCSCCICSLNRLKSIAISASDSETYAASPGDYNSPIFINSKSSILEM